ncbi:syntenin-1-like [Arctopsyche grandis]|uniref:syntenin-1-like n=1 Tax=Arctopsyche grandis TaxID=121162 RepID=UPI00406D843E
MALYPSLEDMNVDLMQRAQETVAVNTVAQLQNSNSGLMYPALADFMGLELSPETIAINMPEYSQIVQARTVNNGTASNVVAPLSGGSVAMKKAFVTQGVRQVQLCKDAEGKVGLRLRAVNNGMFICLVMKNTPAALAGLRFGDQILEINNTPLAGKSMDEAHKILKKCPNNGIIMSIRDRPFERTLTLHKDSAGSVGFRFKDGKIIDLVQDSSAARNGLLIDHQLVEINGQNVVGMKDKEIVKVIESSDSVVTLTILPCSIYKHMVNKMAANLLKSTMDHTPVF